MAAPSESMNDLAFHTLGRRALPANPVLAPSARTT